MYVGLCIVCMCVYKCICRPICLLWTQILKCKKNKEKNKKKERKKKRQSKKKQKIHILISAIISHLFGISFWLYVPI